MNANTEVQPRQEACAVFGLFRAVGLAHFSGAETAIVSLFASRWLNGKTVGIGLKVSTFAELAGYDRANINRAMKALIRGRVLLPDGAGYSLNVEWLEWNRVDGSPRIIPGTDQYRYIECGDDGDLQRERGRS